jgi:mannose-6-phosphate isomerase-like protein (cupin superfamily)
LTLVAAAACAQPNGEAIHVTAATILAKTAKTQDGAATWPVPTGPGTTLLAVHRDAVGQVEVHMKLNDELIIQSGHVTELVGGVVSGNHQTAPDEWRGGMITGGKAYKLGPGDVIWIPAGTPHQALLGKGGDVRYLALKFDAR